jgi:MoaA/NifB/PqqE/SkfB family radical SAM enzyme
MLTTNGSLIDKKTSDALIEMRWDEFHFSIDGDNPHTHDALRGQKGSFKKAVQSACRLTTIHPSFTPRLVLHTVITNQNHKQLSGMIKLAYALKAKRVDFDALMAYRPEQKKLLLNHSQQQELQNEATKALALAQELNIESTLENFVHQSRTTRGTTLPSAIKKEGMLGAPCLKPWHHLVISHNGRTAPCCVLSGEGPSIKKTSFMDFWNNSTYFQQLRSSMHKHQPTKRCAECSWNILRHEAEIRTHLTKSNTHVDQHQS